MQRQHVELLPAPLTAETVLEVVAAVSWLAEHSQVMPVPFCFYVYVPPVVVVPKLVPQLQLLQCLMVVAAMQEGLLLVVGKLVQQLQYMFGGGGGVVSRFQ